MPSNAWSRSADAPAAAWAGVVTANRGNLHDNSMSNSNFRRERHRDVAISSQQLLNGAGLVRKTYGRLKNAIGNILNDSFRCTGRTA